MFYYQKQRLPLLYPVQEAISQIEEPISALRNATSISSQAYLRKIIAGEVDNRLDTALAIILTSGLELTLVPQDKVDDYVCEIPKIQTAKELIPHSVTDPRVLSAVKQLGNELASLRKRSGYDLSEISALLGMGEITLERVENITLTLPKLSTVQRYGDALGLRLIAIPQNSAASNYAAIPNEVTLEDYAMPSPFYRGSRNAIVTLPRLDPAEKKTTADITQKARDEPSRNRKFIPIAINTHDKPPINPNIGGHVTSTEQDRSPANVICLFSELTVISRPNSWAVRQCEEAISTLYKTIVTAIEESNFHVSRAFLEGLVVLKDFKVSDLFEVAFKLGLILEIKFDDVENGLVTKASSMSKLSSVLYGVVEADGGKEVVKATRLTKASIDKAVNSPGSVTISTLMRICAGSNLSLSLQHQ